MAVDYQKELEDWISHEYYDENVHKIQLPFANVSITLDLITQFFFCYSVLRPFQDYFSSYEMGQSVGGAKTGEPQEKPPGTPASRTWLVSHVARVVLKPTPDTGVR